MLTYEDRMRIQKEVVLQLPIAKADNEEQAQYREQIEKDVEDIGAKGWIVDVIKE